jgi:hypothetical protein
MACLLILQDEYGRDLEILQEEPKTAEELLKHGYYH